MKKIGIVGLGGIFQKAYLPYLRTLSGIEWHLFTRNQSVLAKIATSLPHSQTYTTVQELANLDLDGVMIHVATKAHMEIAELFLEKGIPVYMDKPLTEDVYHTATLYQLAQSKGVLLMAGFNRRFAPTIQNLKSKPDKRRIVVEKNEVNDLGSRTFKLFDLFIHPLDTALYLLDDQPLSATYSYLLDNGQLSQVLVTLHSKQTSVLASMNLRAGSRREIMEVQTPQATYQVKNLEELRTYTASQEILESFGSWDSTLYKRGFESMVDAFLDALVTKQNPVNPSSSLLSHWICHQIAHAEHQTGELHVNIPTEINLETPDTVG
ncbi:Gfo/Idh/MocA family oxidoreductase [Streptococcus suis]|nr:Gfo/Idh/MocA family oxidoreductase [Streptococcus suis]NQR00335.1 Gfo/Idh/MocA family oxidoreductase [Streptococcus suis]